MAAREPVERTGVEETAATFVRLREATARWVREERTRSRLASGVAELDALLAGGWPQGKVGEMVGPLSSGRTGVAMATVAAATARGEVVAWIDAADVFDPGSSSAAGVGLERVLWVRPRTLEEAVRAAELVLETGGFTVVVLDVSASAHADAARKEHRGTLRLRLARAVERANAVALVVAERSWIGTIAGVTVSFQRSTPQWQGGEHKRKKNSERDLLPRSSERDLLPRSVGGTGGSKAAGGGVESCRPPETRRSWLAGIALAVRVERGGAHDTRRNATPVLAWRDLASGA